MLLLWPNMIVNAMKLFVKLGIIILCFFSCKGTSDINQKPTDDFVITFGSCNNQELENVLWDEVLKYKPNLWIWGGDNVYSDTDDMAKLRKDYKKQLENEKYKLLSESTKIIGTWDDHDYGLNDGGVEFHAKQASQQEFLNFLGVDKDDKRRDQEGVYNSVEMSTKKGDIKVIVLDTRFFRTKLTKAKNTGRRYDPNAYGKGTILGEKQWNWLEKELSNSKANFNLIVSSVQILSDEHGFECWGNFPHEVDKLMTTIKSSKAKGVIILSGDRHISEFSKTTIKGLSYPIIDFTSSGLTHAYTKFTKETNSKRVGNVVSELSFGVLKFNFETNSVIMQMRGEKNVLQQELIQSY